MSIARFVVLVLALLCASGARATEADEFQQLLRHGELPSSFQLGSGEPLTEEKARLLWGTLLSSPVTPGSFAPRVVLARMAREVLSAGAPVSYSQLLLSTARFRPLVVMRPDGYCAAALTGRPLARMGTLSLRDGELYVLGLRVGAFYFNDGGNFFPVDEALGKQQKVPPASEQPLGRDPATAALLGAQDAVEEMVRGLAALVAHPVRTLEGLSQLPHAVAGLVAQSPEYFARFKAMTRQDQVREAARLTTHVLTLRGGAAAAGPRLSQATRLPVLTVTAGGELAVSEVAVSAGAMTAVVGAGAASASLVFMTQESGAPGGGDPWPPASGGPGQWVRKQEKMSPEAQRYQSEVTGAPEGWVYRVRTGPGPKDHVDFDGFQDGVLQEIKGPGYQELLRKMYGKKWFEGVDDMVAQAERQIRAAGGHPIHWHFAEEEVAELVRKIFKGEDLSKIRVIHKPYRAKEGTDVR